MTQIAELERRITEHLKLVQRLEYQIVELESCAANNVYKDHDTAAIVIMARFENMAHSACMLEGEKGDAIYVQPYTLEESVAAYKGFVIVNYELLDNGYYDITEIRYTHTPKA